MLKYFTKIKQKYEFFILKLYMNVLYKIYSLNNSMYQEYDYSIEKGQHYVYMENFCKLNLDDIKKLVLYYEKRINVKRK